MTFNEGLLVLKAPANFNEDLCSLGKTVTVTSFEEELSTYSATNQPSCSPTHRTYFKLILTSLQKEKEPVNARGDIAIIFER